MSNVSDLDFLREMRNRFNNGRDGDETEFDMVDKMMSDWIEELEGTVDATGESK